MKRMVFFLVLMVTSFVFPSKLQAVLLNGECGDNNEICCEKNGQLTCFSENLLCVKRDKYNVCVLKNEKIGTCECERHALPFGGFQSCQLVDNNNYCDVTTGQLPFCVVIDTLDSMHKEGVKCGYNLDDVFVGTCKCKTQVDANLDPEINGYNRYYKFDTCKSSPTGLWLPHYYIDFDYCDKSTKEAKLFKRRDDVECVCVEKGFVGNYDGAIPLRLNEIVDKPGSGLSDIARQKINGVGITLFCEDTSGNVDNENLHVNTAIGCVPITIGGLVPWLIPKLVGIIGGISFLIMVYGFIMIATSGGDPKKAQAAKETITAAITGLILSIFAIFLVRLIMIYVLRLPGVK